MENRELVILDCFQSWLEKDKSKFIKCFAPNAHYIESWGPAYHTLKDITRWFCEWNTDNVVLQWDIKRFWHENDISICEWYVKCKCNGEIDGFDGVSIIQFDDSTRIVWLKEFQSKTPNCYPCEIK